VPIVPTVPTVAGGQDGDTHAPGDDAGDDADASGTEDSTAK
jgi:hypothetical protein